MGKEEARLVWHPLSPASPTTPPRHLKHPKFLDRGKRCFIIRLLVFIRAVHHSREWYSQCISHNLDHLLTRYLSPNYNNSNNSNSSSNNSSSNNNSSSSSNRVPQSKCSNLKHSQAPALWLATLGAPRPILLPRPPCQQKAPLRPSRSPCSPCLRPSQCPRTTP